MSSWNFSRAKRVIDILLSVLLLLLTSPLWLLAALAIKLTSPGPVFFRQVRVGQNRKAFRVFKFRSMGSGAVPGGSGLTRAGDQRVTRVGRRLRQWKIDELPQVLNVIRGEMSMVGPRPDLPQYLAALPAWESLAFSLRPGVTGAASLAFRNEEEVLAEVPAERLHEFYVTDLLPRKLRIDLEYARRASFAGDLSIMLRTATAVWYRDRVSKN